MLQLPAQRLDEAGERLRRGLLDRAALGREALGRLRSYCGMQSRSRLYASAGDVGVLRAFAPEPRSDGVVGVSGETGGERWSARLDLSLHGDAQDDQSVRPDGSYLAGQAGNWVVSAGWLDRWWGPGWDGSLIWSNNARPLPGIALDRVRSTPFETKWLSWIGPWRATFFLGALERERADIDNALFTSTLSDIGQAKGHKVEVEH